EAARPELSHLAADLEEGRALVDEVELVLLVVIVLEALESGREHDRVDAEGTDAERAPYLSEAVALAELVERPERVAHGLSLREEFRYGVGCFLERVDEDVVAARDANDAQLGHVSLPACELARADDALVEGQHQQRRRAELRRWRGPRRELAEDADHGRAAVELALCGVVRRAQRVLRADPDRP